MKIFLIDAWADCCGCDHPKDGPEACWTWNNWFHVGDIEKLPDKDGDLIPLMIERGFLKPVALELCKVEDDQFNLVIIEKETLRPLYAVEYGANYGDNLLSER